MVRTPLCNLLEIEHPIALGGMGSASSPAMTAAVSRAGGLGAMGCHYLTPEQIRERTVATRKETNRPFGLNFLLFDIRQDAFAEALALRPAVMQFAWARADQELEPYFTRAHEAGCKVTYMAGAVSEAVRAVKAGADVIIAQGSEGGGHVGWMGSMPLIPMVVDAVAPIPFSRRAASRTVAVWSQRCHSGRKAFCSAHDFWPVRNRRCIRTSNKRSSTATVMTGLGWCRTGRTGTRNQFLPWLFALCGI